MKLNLGCWKRDLPGFTNVDMCDLPHIHIRSDISTLPMIADGSVDLIYCSHALEYFDRQGVQKALVEWHRVLRPEGILRLSVPDFQQLIKIYDLTGRLETITGPIYGRMPVQDDLGNVLTEVWHKSLFDRRSLQLALEEAGFVDVHPWDWRSTEHAAIDDHSQAHFPHMDKDGGIQVSLNLEAVKR